MWENQCIQQLHRDMETEIQRKYGVSVLNLANLFTDTQRRPEPVFATIRVERTRKKCDLFLVKTTEKFPLVYCAFFSLSGILIKSCKRHLSWLTYLRFSGNIAERSRTYKLSLPYYRFLEQTTDLLILYCITSRRKSIVVSSERFFPHYNHVTKQLFPFLREENFYSWTSKQVRACPRPRD